jgi:hypothetical protein
MEPRPSEALPTEPAPPAPTAPVVRALVVTERSEPAAADAVAAAPALPRDLSDARFATIAAVIITLVSILIAVSAWRTTEAASRASDLDSLVIQQLARRQQELGALNGMVDLDLHLLTRYQAYLLAADHLDAAAKAAGEPGAIDRQMLELEAQGERSLARVMNQFFLGAFPTVGDAGVADYDPDRVLRGLVAGSYRLTDLRPEATARRATLVHQQTAAFVVLVILFSACLVLLTLAQVRRGRLRVPLAATGTLLAVGGVVLLVLTETILFAGG